MGGGAMAQGVAAAVGYGSAVLFVLVMVASSVVDMRERRIPNELVVAAAFAWIVARALLGACSGSVAGAVIAPLKPWGLAAADAAIGALVLGGGVLLVTVAFEAVSGRVAMGGGDIKLLAIVGLFMGWERGLVCLFVACVVSVVVSTVRRIAGSLGAGTFPFAPALLAGAAAAALL